MKRILIIGGMAMLCHLSGFAQSNPATLAKPSQPKTNATTTTTTAVAPTQTQAEKEAAALAKTNNQAASNAKLGLPANASASEYRAAKEQLYYENRAEYDKLKGANLPNEARPIARADYNKLPADKKAHIDANPAKYKVVD